MKEKARYLELGTPLVFPQNGSLNKKSFWWSFLNFTRLQFSLTEILTVQDHRKHSFYFKICTSCFYFAQSIVGSSRLSTLIVSRVRRRWMLEVQKTYLSLDFRSGVYADEKKNLKKTKKDRKQFTHTMYKLRTASSDERKTVHKLN